MNNALVYGASRVTLIALWNEKIVPDGPGGTLDMVETAGERGAKVLRLNAEPLAHMAPGR